LPEKNKWVKIEIPFSYLKENSLKAIGFYHNKGSVLWDRISIDDIAADCEVIKCMKEKSPASAYFNYEIEGPFEYRDEKFFSLKLDASPSSGKNFLWNIDGKIYKNKKIKVSFNKLKNPLVELNVEKDGEKDKIKHLFNISDIPVEKVKLIVKIYPLFLLTLISFLITRWKMFISYLEKKMVKILLFLLKGIEIFTDFPYSPAMLKLMRRKSEK